MCHACPQEQMLAIRAVFLLLTVLPFATAQGPTSALEAALQAIVTELRQLSQDIQTTTVTSHRVQILLYRIQLQQASTARALTRADEVRSKLASAQEARARNTKELDHSGVREQHCRSI